MRGNEKLVLALPKGRILKSVVPLLARTGIFIEPEFDDEESRQLRFQDEFCPGSTSFACAISMSRPSWHWRGPSRHRRQ